VKIQVGVFRGCDAGEDGIRMVLRNVGILPQRYTASQPEDLDLNSREAVRMGQTRNT